MQADNVLAQTDEDFDCTEYLILQHLQMAAVAILFQRQCVVRATARTGHQHGRKPENAKR